MPLTVVISRDPALRETIEGICAQGGGRVEWVESCADLRGRPSLHPAHLLVDLNVRWAAEDVLGCISRCKAQHPGSKVIAFLHEYAGDLAVRARLAGADRVIPQNQLERELPDLLRPQAASDSEG
jgi:DNA-binding NtrC family response regulator